MEGYKLRQSVIFVDARATELKVFEELDLYAALMSESAARFRIDKDILEVCLFLCWDMRGNITTEACLLGMWERDR